MPKRRKRALTAVLPRLGSRKPKQLWAVVPVKPFGEGKSRLAERLGVVERGTLSKRLLTGVIQVLQAAKVCAGILVISRDDHVLAYATSLGVSTLLEESSNPDPMIDKLNGALHQASTEVVQRGADAVLVLPADLPLITPEDVVRLYRACQENNGQENGDRENDDQAYNGQQCADQESGCVVIAPSKDRGTNALLLHPPGCINFAFGIHSFELHQAQAQQKEIPFKIIHSSTLAFDLDRPADLDEFQLLDQAISLTPGPSPNLQSTTRA